MTGAALDGMAIDKGRSQPTPTRPSVLQLIGCRYRRFVFVAVSVLTLTSFLIAALVETQPLVKPSNQG